MLLARRLSRLLDLAATRRSAASVLSRNGHASLHGGISGDASDAVPGAAIARRSPRAGGGNIASAIPMASRQLPARESHWTNCVRSASSA
jgi:hypothetical protein